jgi:hypothetical protein
VTIDPAHIVAQLVGPLFYRRWFSRQPVDAKFVQGLIDAVTGA